MNEFDESFCSFVSYNGRRFDYGVLIPLKLPTVLGGFNAHLKLILVKRSFEDYLIDLETIDCLII